MVSLPAAGTATFSARGSARLFFHTVEDEQRGAVSDGGQDAETDPGRGGQARPTHPGQEPKAPATAKATAWRPPAR